MNVPPVDGVAVKVTVPVGVVGLVLTSVTVAVHDVAMPVLNEDGLQETVVFVLVIVTFVVRGAPMLIPLIVSVIVTGEVRGRVTVIAEESMVELVAVKVTLVGTKTTIGPVGEKVADNATVPVNPFRAVTVTVAC